MAPKKKSKTPLIIGGVAGGLVALAGLGVGGFFLVSKLGGGAGGAVDSPRVADLTAEPDAAWSYDTSVGTDEAYFMGSTLTGVDDDFVAVVPTFDYYTFEADNSSEPYWNYDISWYEGYDEHYQDGFEAGLGYLEAQEAYWNDYTYTVPYPDDDDFWPYEGSYWDENYAEYGGFYDGYFDAQYEYENGANALKPPVESDFTPVVALVDLKTGDEVWKLDLADQVGDGVTDTYVTVTDVPKADFLAVSVSGYSEEDSVNVVLTVDKKTGEIIDTVDFGATVSASVYGFEGGLYVVQYDYDDEDGTVQYFTTGKIGDDPKWEVDGDIQYVDEAQGMSLLYGGDSTAVMTATGEEAKIGSGLDESTYITEVGEQLIRAEWDDEFTEVEIIGVNSEGDETWDKSIKAEGLIVVDGAIYVGDSAGEYGYLTENVVRINPKNGEEMWDKEFKDPTATFSLVDGNLVGFDDEDGKIWIVNPKNGEEIENFKAETYDLWIGTSLIYAVDDDKLVAFKAGEGEVWSYNLDDSESIVQYGTHLLVSNYDDNEISGLEVK